MKQDFRKIELPDKFIEIRERLKKGYYSDGRIGDIRYLVDYALQQKSIVKAAHQAGQELMREKAGKICDKYALWADNDCATPEWGCVESAKAIRAIPLESEK